MATVNYSVSDDVKDSFNKTFAGCNKSAIISDLMRRAVEAEELRRRRGTAIRDLLDMKRKVPPMSAEEFRRLREEGRP
jgi:hypothetical protein